MSATSRDDAPVAPLPIPADQFEAFLRMAREVIRQEIRDEFEGRRSAVMVDLSADDLERLRKHPDWGKPGAILWAD